MKIFYLFENTESIDIDRSFINSQLQINTTVNSTKIIDIFDYCYNEVLPYLKHALFPYEEDMFLYNANCFEITNDAKIILMLNTLLVSLHAAYYLSGTKPDEFFSFKPDLEQLRLIRQYRDTLQKKLTQLANNISIKEPSSQEKKTKYKKRDQLRNYCEETLNWIIRTSNGEEIPTDRKPNTIIPWILRKHDFESRYHPLAVYDFFVESDNSIENMQPPFRYQWEQMKLYVTQIEVPYNPLTNPLNQSHNCLENSNSISENTSQKTVINFDLPNNISPSMWFVYFHDYVQLPLTFQKRELVRKLPTLIYNSQNDVGLALTLLYKTFFITLYDTTKKDWKSFIDRLTWYIIKYVDSYIKNYSRAPHISQVLSSNIGGIHSYDDFEITRFAESLLDTIFSDYSYKWNSNLEIRCPYNERMSLSLFDAFIKQISNSTFPPIITSDSLEAKMEAEETEK